MKNIILILFLMLSTLAFSQSEKKAKIKVDKKNNLVTVDGNEYFKYTKKTGAIEIFNLKNEEIAYLNLVCYNDYMEVSESNPKGRVCYYTIDFTGIEEQTEISNYGAKGIAKIFLEHGFYVNGVLNTEETLKFIKRNGRTYSAEQLK